MNPREIKKKFQFLSNSPFHPQWLITRKDKTNLISIIHDLDGIVLDIGCSHMKHKKNVKNTVFYIGLDNYVTATGWYDTKPDIYSNAEVLPFVNKSIENILLLDVLEHLPNPQLCLDEIHRVLVDGGKFILEVPFIYPIHDSPLDFQRWSKYGLRQLIKQKGLTIVEETAIGDPIETAGLLFNIALCKSALDSIEKKNPFLIMTFLLPVIIPIVNIGSVILSSIAPADKFMPFRYRIIAKKL